jgi:hypothetical protein
MSISKPVRMFCWSVFLAVNLLALPTQALASCTTSTVYTGDGKMQLCKTCCTSSGCTVYCF